MKSILSLAVFDICVVLLCSTLFLGVDAGVSTSCKDEFYDSSTQTYRSCKECLQSIEDQCAAVCCKTSITVEPKHAGKDDQSDNKEEKTISETKAETAETDGMRPNVAIVLLLSFFAILVLLVLLLVLVKSMRDRALENRSNRDRCEGFVDIQEVLGSDSIEQDTSAVQEDTSVCSCQVKVTIHPDLALGSQTSLSKQDSPV